MSDDKNWITWWKGLEQHEVYKGCGWLEKQVKHPTKIKLPKLINFISLFKKLSITRVIERFLF